MVRQLHLRTQGGQESSVAHPDVIGDRCVFKREKEWGNKVINCNKNNSKTLWQWIFLFLSIDVSGRAWHYALSTASSWRMSWACVAVCWVSWIFAPLPSGARPAGCLPWGTNTHPKLATHTPTHRWVCGAEEAKKSWIHNHPYLSIVMGSTDTNHTHINAQTQTLIGFFF